MTESSYEANVVEIIIHDHPNANNLGIVSVHGNPVCINKNDWKGIKYGVYIPPDSIVDTTRDEFSFLANGKDDTAIIRAIKLRGVPSVGLLIPAPKWAKLGDNLYDYYGIKHYQPIDSNIKTSVINTAPNIFAPKYDVESILKYKNVIPKQSKVWVSEKIHGANARYVYHNNQMWCGSRNKWHGKESEWYKALEYHPEIEKYCKDHPDIIVYGEIYGKIQKLKYGIEDHCRIFVFDILKGSTWLSPFSLMSECELFKLPIVPTIYIGPYDFDLICELAKGDSLVNNANHIKEGCVIKPTEDIIHDKLGRVALKCINNDYYVNVK